MGGVLRSGMSSAMRAEEVVAVPGNMVLGEVRWEHSPHIVGASSEGCAAFTPEVAVDRYGSIHTASGGNGSIDQEGAGRSACNT